jgi:hypothetical protein
VHTIDVARGAIVFYCDSGCPLARDDPRAYDEMLRRAAATAA